MQFTKLMTLAAVAVLSVAVSNVSAAVRANCAGDSDCRAGYKCCAFEGASVGTCRASCS
ncbi:hypothetical protein BCV70DRAFT_201047 [Testicularia cyperi]|uniref:Uncharacterized protein n=1 Tax=Testicularia cyperi TaxID=1882483 RepID=A0A317XMC7_9BASI|nr:hypothetical protein BCV70DRAFT_201047 [Testicularia cyperi]